MFHESTIFFVNLKNVTHICFFVFVHTVFFAMTERKSVQETLQKWVMCPICRQHTDVRNIAYADDRRNSSSSDQDHKDSEASLVVQGSYGTKVSLLASKISAQEVLLFLIYCFGGRLKLLLEESYGSSQVTHKRRFLFSPAGTMFLMCWNMPSLQIASPASG